ncbi:hypothetical protein [Lentilactobacillus parabuchneri]|uniref:hypothetical protein n=1 Tax=Lentilactobacillus parabuchneri TaxID=152331 RepID=UPI000A104298|nr:hypothetical protein [Lentilactobacillus parabuchneri]ORN05510.1 hypothetical protein FAM21829_00420 [Lentilactobacillus parabuchneri]
MNLKNILYVTGAAMGIFTTSAVAGVTANAAVTPNQKTQQSTKAGNQTKQNSTTTPATQNKDNQSTSQKNTAGNSATKSNQNANQSETTSKKTPATNNQNNNTNKQSSNNQTATKTNNATSTNFDQRAPRLTGASYKSENAGFKTSVKNSHANQDVNVKYSVNTYESDGSASSKPFQIKIYKDGSLYKTINASSGSISGSFKAPKGTYTLRVYTSQSTHYTGGLSVD